MVLTERSGPLFCCFENIRRANQRKDRIPEINLNRNQNYRLEARREIDIRGLLVWRPYLIWRVDAINDSLTFYRGYELLNICSCLHEGDHGDRLWIKMDNAAGASERKIVN